MRSGIAVPDFLFRHGGRQSEEVVQLRGEIAVGRDALEPREHVVFSELLEEEEQFAAVIAGDQIVNAEILFHLVERVHDFSVHHHGGNISFLFFCLHHTKYRHKSIE